MREQNNITNSLAHTKWNCKYHLVFAHEMELQVSFSFCAEIPQRGIFCRKKIRDKGDIAETVCMERSRSNRGRDMSGSHTYAGKYPAQNERFGIYGISEREE